jgi:hypothetical protein
MFLRTVKMAIEGSLEKLQDDLFFTCKMIVEGPQGETTGLCQISHRHGFKALLLKKTQGLPENGVLGSLAFRQKLRFRHLHPAVLNVFIITPGRAKGKWFLNMFNEGQNRLLRRDEEVSQPCHVLHVGGRRVGRRDVRDGRVDAGGLSYRASETLLSCSSTANESDRVPVASNDCVIILDTFRGPNPSKVTLRGDGTAKLREHGKVVRRQKVERQEILELLERMLAMRFFELRDVLDRGMTRHPRSFRIMLCHEGREHSVHFDANRFAAELQALMSMIQTIAHDDFWEPKPPSDER